MPTRISEPITVLDALIAAIEGACEYNRNDQEAPAAVLWTDHEHQWELLLPRLRSVLPQMLTLGDFSPTSKTGPAIWIKCMISRQLPEPDWPEQSVPIIYLPGISRQQLRAVEDCSKAIQPLMELQFRGTFFTQVNARDWTVSAFLCSDRGGLGLDVSRDKATLEAIDLAVEKIAESPIRSLQRRRLEASDFTDMVKPDPVRDLLTWMNSPAETQEKWSRNEWQAFCKIVKKQYALDPERDGEVLAAEKLGKREGDWKKVWARFEEAPTLYCDLPNLLRRAKPTGLTEDLFRTSTSWPQDNEEMESQLRAELVSLEGNTIQEAADAVRMLEEAHAERRTSVWAALGQAPLAESLRWIKKLSDHTDKPLTGYDAKSIAEQYIESGWQADAAVIRALASVERLEDVTAVNAAIRALYQRWLEDSAEKLQQLIQEHPLPDFRTREPFDRPEPGTCLLFADGLRYDVSMMLKEILMSQGLGVDASWHWAGIPTVTPTSKPANSPIAALLEGGKVTEDFRPQTVKDKKNITHDRFHVLLKDAGFQVLANSDLGDPNKTAWTEYGSLDRVGHEQGWKISWRINEEIRGLSTRIDALLSHGWKRVRVVTDHGWLLLPGGLAKADMPSYLVESRWGRCAVPKSGAKMEHPKVKWHWNPNVEIVVAPGVKCFKAGMQYAHGGISAQECIIPTLTITAGAKSLHSSAISSVSWRGMRCRIEVTGAPEGATVDIRTELNNPSSSVSSSAPALRDNTASTLVKDDSLEGHAAMVVLLDKEGTILAKEPTVVGE